MDDEEIVKLWGSIGGEIHIKEAIRLYRMAELNTKQAVIDRQLPENFQKEIEQARADEREKCNWAHNEAYAKGKAECQATYANLEDVYKTQFQEGYKKGQADLLDKLEKDQVEVWHNKCGWDMTPLINWIELQRRKASESLGAKGNEVATHLSARRRAKLSSKHGGLPANPKNACKHKNIESEISNGDVAWNCQDCGESHNWEETKPEKPKYPIKKSYSILHSNKSCGITHAINCVVCDCSCHDKPKGLAEHAKPNKEQTKED